MKFIITGLLLVAIGCSHLAFAQQPQAENFVITGHIDSIKDGTKVMLYDIEGQLVIDSAVSSHGKFVLRGHVERPATCWIQCMDEYAIIQVENTQMEFTSPLKRMFLYASIKGGKEQELQNQLDAMQRPYDRKFYTVYDSLMNKQYTDEAHKARLITVFNSYQDASQNIYVTFGKQHPDSFLGLSILYRNRQRIEKDTIKAMISRMSVPIQSASEAKALIIYANNELAEKGKSFLDFEAKTINDKKFKLSSLKGKYVLLSFWSAGCGPCRMENRNFSKHYDSLRNKIAIVSFSTDKNKSQWIGASRTDNILWTNVSDLAGDNGRIKTLYDVQAIPTSFLINKDGIVVEKFIGFDDDFLTQLDKLIK